MVERSTWAGAIGARPSDPTDAVPIVAVLGQSPGGGGSQPFPVRDDQGRRWWVKARNNPQNGKVIVTEQIVAGVGSLIGAPVCGVAVVRIPEELAGFEYAQGRTLEAGLTHGCLAVSDAREVRGAPAHRSDDDNARRHAGIFALYDWCWGGDPQYLHCETADSMIYSHDHGFYFPPESADWDEASLAGAIDQPHTAGWPADGVSDSAIDDVAQRLDSLDRDSLAGVLRSIPTTWPVTDDELEACGWFLESRTGPVAERLRALTVGTS